VPGRTFGRRRADTFPRTTWPQHWATEDRAGYFHPPAGGPCSVARLARRSVDDPSNAGVPARFTDIDCAQHIVAGVESRIGHRSTKVDLRGKVEDDVRVRPRDDADQVWRLNVGLYQGKSARAATVVALRMLQVGRIPVQKLSIPPTW
jgi:hypothetical protein